MLAAIIIFEIMSLLIWIFLIYIIPELLWKYRLARRYTLFPFDNLNYLEIPEDEQQDTGEKLDEVPESIEKDQTQMQEDSDDGIYMDCDNWLDRAGRDLSYYGGTGDALQPKVRYLPLLFSDEAYKFPGGFQNYLRVRTLQDHRAIKPDETRPPRKIICFRCREPGHHYNRCPHPWRGEVCYRCGYAGVTVRTCPQCSDQWKEKFGPANVSSTTSYPSDTPSRDRSYDTSTVCTEDPWD